MQILDGIRVIDITQFISGSRCTQIMADMGAEVVKVEPPQGDTLRMIFGLVPGAERNYSIYNRNKYGIAVDSRDQRGQEIIRKLAANSDILVHNLIPGTMEKYGLGYDDIKKVRPDIIYTAISGFGTDSVAPERAAFDIVAQATGGQFWNDQESLTLPANYWGDLISGGYAAMATLLALIHRMKTGNGQYVDVSMQDVMYFNNYRAMCERSMTPIIDEVTKQLGRRPADVLNSSDRMPFYGFFKSKDGKVAIVAATPRQWKILTETIGQPEMANDPRFNNLIVQIQNHSEAVRIIEEWTTQRESKDIIAILESKKIPCGVAYTSDQVNEDKNLERRGMFQKVPHSQFGDVDIPGFPFKFSKTEGSIRLPAPGLGEHSRFILKKWLDYPEEEVNDLYAAGVIK